ncbi:ABC transporter permease [Micromonospora terminaliae]|uniref:ABC transporter permease n=1 Tax=Micromonospora terminaliae TaxID=1914461 RepID=A0AAJ2ZFV3_9ACTN|nr:ABC transporter permease [Micromonospora terminaliae]NES28941.1 ABC transporter permease [Micromonospora terminaliae]QGL49039.1 ABC transporter permease [Micromonospora terminaliae]
MTAPTINGTRYPQPVDALLPAARKLVDELGEVPSRNRLMREYRIGAPKADELLTRLREEHLRRQLAEQFGYTPPDERPADKPTADPWDYAEPIGPDPAPVDDRAETLRHAMIVRGALLTPRTDPADTRPEDAPVPGPQPAPAAPVAEPVEQVTAPGHPGTPTVAQPGRRAVAWPVILLALPAFVAIWSGWVGLGGLTGFGVVHPLPGIADGVSLNTAITLPIGVETYGAYALYVWLSGRVPNRARTFAKWSAIASLAVGALGQVAYHLLVAAGVTSAPWWITTLVSCLPVAVLGMGAALAHLVREDVTK